MKVLIALALLSSAAASADQLDAQLTFVDESCSMLGASIGSGPASMTATAASHSCVVAGRDASMSCVDADGEIGNLVFLLDKKSTARKQQTIWREGDGRSVIYLAPDLRYIWSQTEVVPGKGVLHRQCTGTAIRRK